MSGKRAHPEGHKQHRAHTFAASAKSSGPGLSWASSGGKYQIGKVMSVPRAMGELVRLSQREIKYVDNALTNTTFRQSGIPPTGIYLGGPIQGAAPYQRVGTKIMNRSLHLRGVLLPQLTDLGGIGRILVVYDRESNGALPGWADVIQGTTAAAAISNTTYDGVNMGNRMRFKVLIDEQFSFPSLTYAAGVVTNLAQLDTTGNSSAAKYNFERYVRLNDLPTHFKATAGGIGDVANGALIMFCVQENTDASWLFQWGSRLRYDDV